MRDGERVRQYDKKVGNKKREWGEGVRTRVRPRNGHVRGETRTGRDQSRVSIGLRHSRGQHVRENRQSLHFIEDRRTT